MSLCTFCNEAGWAGGSGISICRSCAAKVGRLMVLLGPDSNKYWSQGHSPVQILPREGVTPQKEWPPPGIDVQTPEEFVQRAGTLEMRLSGLGFFASTVLLRWDNPAA